MTNAVSTATSKARHRGILLPDVELDFDDIGVVTVAMVLADPDKFVGETLADPLEGIDYGRCKAKVMRASDGTLVIHTFAHGGGLYRLRHDARSATAALTDARPTPRRRASSTMQWRYWRSASWSLMSLPASLQLSPKPPVFRCQRSRRAWQSSSGNVHERSAQADLDAEADGRIIRLRPEPDGELTPTVMFVDELLASDKSEEPPMRDASGELVEVRVQEPWALHELNSDTTNNTAADGGDVMKAPAEPGSGTAQLCGCEHDHRALRPLADRQEEQGILRPVAELARRRVHATLPELAAGGARDQHGARSSRSRALSSMALASIARPAWFIELIRYFAPVCLIVLRPSRTSGKP